MKTHQKLINLKEAPLSLKEAKAKLLTLTIKNPIFWLKAIILIVGIVISISFLLPMTIEVFYKSKEIMPAVVLITLGLAFAVYLFLTVLAIIGVVSMTVGRSLNAMFKKR